MGERAHDCDTPDVAWRLVSHHIGNDLLSLAVTCRRLNQAPEDERVQIENDLYRLRMQLVGALHLIERRMEAGGYAGDASRIRKILDVAAASDVTDHYALRRIQEEYDLQRP